MKTNNKIYPATLLCDFYKTSHINQYPKGTEVIYSTWTPRMSRIDGVTEVVAFGFQSFIKEYLLDYFEQHFFSRPLVEVVGEYKRVIRHSLGVETPHIGHIVKLWNLRHLPVKIRAVKEGTLVPIRVPMLTIENTHPEFFWITNYLETLMSAELWLPTNSATIAFQYRKILSDYAMKTVGHTDDVPLQGHDFSMRGMGGLHAAAKSGAGHLLSFTGTDTIPAIHLLEAYYNADIEKELVGTSIPATEHSVMCANGTDELESFRRLIEDVYPKGFVSIVSDTWDFWSVIEKVIPRLKDSIMARDGRVVIRPDSGDPEKIICGDPEAETKLEQQGLIEALWDIFGGTYTSKGYKLLDSHIGAIYGDSITLERAEEICSRLEKKGFASTNIILGIGSFSYQFNTRDSLGFAMKATYTEVNGEGKFLFKDPKTDSGMKKSQKGLVVVKKDDGQTYYIDELDRETQQAFGNEDLLEDVFVDGKLLRDDSLADIRARLSAELYTDKAVEKVTA